MGFDLVRKLTPLALRLTSLAAIMTKHYKFLNLKRGKIVSDSGSQKWKVGVISESTVTSGDRKEEGIKSLTFGL